MDLEVLRSFLAVSKYKSLSKAADSMHMTQPTLSARIKNLENQLNVPLLTRDWQGVRLTNYGLLLLPHSIDMLNRLIDFTSITKNYKDINRESLLNSIDTMNNTFRIGINNYLTEDLSAELINFLVEEYPEVKFEILTQASPNLKEMIDFDALDLIIYYSSEEINQPTTKLIARDQMVFVFNQNDSQLMLEDGKNLGKINKPLLLNSNPALDRYLKYFQHAIKYLQVKDVQIVSNLNIMRQLIVANQGYAAIPESVYQVHFKSANLHAHQLLEDLPALPIYMTMRESSQFIGMFDAIYHTLTQSLLLNQNNTK